LADDPRNHSRWTDEKSTILLDRAMIKQEFQNKPMQEKPRCKKTALLNSISEKNSEGKRSSLGNSAISRYQNRRFVYRAAGLIFLCIYRDGIPNAREYLA